MRPIRLKRKVGVQVHTLALTTGQALFLCQASFVPRRETDQIQNGSIPESPRPIRPERTPVGVAVVSEFRVRDEHQEALARVDAT